MGPLEECSKKQAVGGRGSRIAIGHYDDSLGGQIQIESDQIESDPLAGLSQRGACFARGTALSRQCGAPPWASSCAARAKAHAFADTADSDTQAHARL